MESVNEAANYKGTTMKRSYALTILVVLSATIQMQAMMASNNSNHPTQNNKKRQKPALNCEDRIQFCEREYGKIPRKDSAKLAAVAVPTGIERHTAEGHFNGMTSEQILGPDSGDVDAKRCKTNNKSN